MPFTVKNIQLTPEEEKKIKTKIKNDRYNDKRRIKTLESHGFVVMPRDLWNTIMRDNDESYEHAESMRKFWKGATFILLLILICGAYFCLFC